MGKVVAVVSDKFLRDRCVWVQFGDGALDVGDQCVCGSRDIVRLHRHWARCTECRRLLEINNPDREVDADAAGTVPEPFGSPADVQRPTTLKGLDAFEGLTLYRYRIAEDVEQCFGIGRRPGDARFLVSVRFPLEDGRRIPDPGVPGQWLYTFTKAALGDFAELLDLANLDDGARVSWRIDEDPGPRAHSDFEEPAPG
jgi:hypothetical protein